jgi:hypothetical protein
MYRARNPSFRSQVCKSGYSDYLPNLLILAKGVPRANIAPSEEKPHGTTENDWAKKHSHQTVLQQHGDFFDRDKDGILWPQDTYIGFRRLGFNFLISFIAILVIHINFSYATCSGWMPDPFFRLFLNNAHKTKHGSDTGTFDNEGRFIPQRFEDIFTKYADGRDYLTLSDLSNMLKGQRINLDPIGWAGAVFECKLDLWGIGVVFVVKLCVG